MSGKKRFLLFFCPLIGVALLALAGAIPYAYFVQILALASESGLTEPLCWALYIVVSALLWLVVWRIAYLLVRRWPGGK